MIVFPSESLLALRRNLADRMKAGDLSQADAYREAAEADPNDSLSLLFLALEAEEAGDLAESERLARRVIRNHPSGHAGYMLLQRLLAARDAEPQLAEGYAILGLEKITYDEDAVEKVDFRKLLPGLAGRDRNYEVLQLAIENLKQKRLPEAAEVMAELEPHRLIHELREIGEDPLPKETIDGVLENAAECAPMLLGILKEYGENLIPEEDNLMVFRALALLGEIGEPETLPEIAEFLEAEEETLGDVAGWAFRRISFRRPEEALQKIRETIPRCDAMVRADLALQIAELPSVPGRFEALRSVLDKLERESKEDQEALVVGAISAAWLMQGSSSEYATSLMKKYGGTFSASTHKDLKKMRAEGAGLGPYVATEDPGTIYDICGEDPDPTEPVVKAPTPGRNDPCWCGSGKKYKKCHLDADAGR